jgi:hypothetical protein
LSLRRSDHLASRSDCQPLFDGRSDHLGTGSGAGMGATLGE